MQYNSIKTMGYGVLAADGTKRLAPTGEGKQTALEVRAHSDIISGNKTRQGYVLRNTLKPAGYFFLASPKLLRPVL